MCHWEGSLQKERFILETWDRYINFIKFLWNLSYETYYGLGVYLLENGYTHVLPLIPSFQTLLTVLYIRMFPFSKTSYFHLKSHSFFNLHSKALKIGENFSFKASNWAKQLVYKATFCSEIQFSKIPTLAMVSSLSLVFCPPHQNKMLAWKCIFMKKVWNGQKCPNMGEK